ncbi:hypothetical protein EBQ11_02035 [Trueperella pyogenes]|nr:hypothetical protein DDE06_10220 [Trueperella pyogenes]AZR04139.1 hypothetical protein EBQ11_02035 [Trueperella pyogenes]
MAMPTAQLAPPINGTQKDTAVHCGLRKGNARPATMRAPASCPTVCCRIVPPIRASTMLSGPMKMTGVKAKRISTHKEYGSSTMQVM